jgi:hypothetical protein
MAPSPATAAAALVTTASRLASAAAREICNMPSRKQTPRPQSKIGASSVLLQPEALGDLALLLAAVAVAAVDIQPIPAPGGTFSSFSLLSHNLSYYICFISFT